MTAQQLLEQTAAQIDSWGVGTMRQTAELLRHLAKDPHDPDARATLERTIPDLYDLLDRAWDQALTGPVIERP